MNVKALKKAYKEKADTIKSRLNDFKNLKEEEYFKEFQYCLLTPQSNAKKCWEAVEELSKLKRLNQESVTNILKTRTRFHNTKTKRILNAEKSFREIKPLLKNVGTRELRNQISEKVNGYGLKEASHFLRNIGKSNNQLTILDRHILKHINEEKVKSNNHYLELEQKFLKLAKSLWIPADELDLLFWSQENGTVFK